MAKFRVGACWPGGQSKEGDAVPRCLRVAGCPPAAPPCAGPGATEEERGIPSFPVLPKPCPSRDQQGPSVPGPGSFGPRRGGLLPGSRLGHSAILWPPVGPPRALLLRGETELSLPIHARGGGGPAGAWVPGDFPLVPGA
jgi:hypothetical protein